MVFATPLPQLSKISDLLTGQGPQFQAAIASHLFSPFSFYQTRIPGYEVSAPIPSKLAYTEKFTYTPQNQQQQLTPQVFKQPHKQAHFIRVNYPQQLQQQAQVQYQQLQAPQIQSVFQQQQPQVFDIQPYQQLAAQFAYNQQPVQYQGPVQFSQQPLAYVQQQLPANVQPGIVYAREEDNNPKPVQRESKPAQPEQVLQNVQVPPKQDYNAQNQAAVSFASFSVGPPALVPQPQQNLQQQQPQAIQYQTQPQLQYQPQLYQIQQVQPVQQYQPTQQLQQKQVQQYQIERQPQQFNQRAQPLFSQSQHQQQIHQQLQPQTKPEPSPANSVNIPSKPVPLSSDKQQLNYYRPEPVLYQPQIYQNQGLVPNIPPQQVLAVPTYPAVQFFGKFAHELFRNYQQ